MKCINCGEDIGEEKVELCHFCHLDPVNGPEEEPDPEYEDEDEVEDDDEDDEDEDEDYYDLFDDED